MRRAAPAWMASIVVAAATGALAHDGPPFPIVSDRLVGAYRVSVWTDPDTTDDGTAGGQFWVRVYRARLENDSRPHLLPPPGTRVRVAIRPLDRPGAQQAALAEPVRGDITNQFAGLVMAHEGRFAVRVTIAGPLGDATVESQVEATYDLRPPPYLLALYVLPFLLAGVLWGRLIVRRRSLSRCT